LTCFCGLTIGQTRFSTERNRRADYGTVNVLLTGVTTMNPAVIEAHRAPDPVPADEPTPEPFDNPHPHHPPVHTPQDDDQVPDPNPFVYFV
jgi:hypothetical protein